MAGIVEPSNENVTDELAVFSSVAQTQIFEAQAPEIAPVSARSTSPHFLLNLKEVETWFFGWNFLIIST